MELRPIKIKFQNGLSFDTAVDEILSELVGQYCFIDSADPDFIIFGPYGNDIPEKGNYVRVGYYCENIIPDMEICDWAFGVPTKAEIDHPKYQRIQWHGLDPKTLIKNVNQADEFAKKTKFCNFLYSNPIAYREEFFRQLSLYKRVDAPGKSANNMPSVEARFKGAKYDAKRQFLMEYKFTIAFESFVYPGYQTEKLYDAMRANSIPIYCGDPLISQIFNPASFINAFDYIPLNNSPLKRFLESFSQYNFKDYRPATYNSLYYKVRRKLKTIAKKLKMNLELNGLDYGPLIARIQQLDNDPEAYQAMLSEPWFKDNRPPASLSSAERWHEIFASKAPIQ